MIPRLLALQNLLGAAFDRADFDRREVLIGRIRAVSAVLARVV